MLVNVPRVLAEFVLILAGNVPRAKPVRGSLDNEGKISRVKYGLNVMNRMDGSAFKALRRGITLSLTWSF